MPLKLVKIEPRIAKGLLVLAAILCVIAVWFSIRWHFANAVSSRIDLKRPESKLVIDWLIGLAPSDSQPHYAAAAIFEKTFDPQDLERSLNEYETAAALSPYNYQMWINLGRARSLQGDDVGAEAAFNRALSLAPNYSGVQWAAGNFLIRQGRTAEGFDLAAKAAASNPEFAKSAVSIALQIFEGDIGQVRAVLGDGEAVNAELTAALATQMRYEDAIASWGKLSPDARAGARKKLGEDLAAQLISAKRFRLAGQVVADLAEAPGDKPETGKIANGGFENGIKLRGARVFEWQLAEGAEPQVGLSNTQKRSGNFGLLLVFNSFDASDFRSLAQTVPVIPGASYEFEGFYRLDVKSAANLRIEIANAADGQAIAATPPFALAGDWTTLRLQFTVPPSSDGIVVRLARDGCAGTACRITGRLSLDDLSIRAL